MTLPDELRAVVDGEVVVVDAADATGFGDEQVLRALGVDERVVRVERDGWIPRAARSPERVPEWMARKRRQLADPQLVDFYLTMSRALDSADSADAHPQLAELADELADYITRIADEEGEFYVDDTGLESSFAELLDTHVFESLPPSRRLVELLRKRGWTGWTKLARHRHGPG
ncbi:hypothetical protein [Streptomyces flavofungini]|uniref:hypothetical protein n=1 Tax=Streptomyces flavofungini TaxID=68200 RepID=UPI0034DE783D